MTDQIVDAINQNPQYFGLSQGISLYHEVDLFNSMVGMIGPDDFEEYLVTGINRYANSPEKITDADLVAYNPEKSAIIELKAHINVDGSLRTASDSGRYQVIKASMQLIKAALFLETNFDVDYSLVSVQGIKMAGEQIFVSTRHYTYSTNESGLTLVDKKSNVPLEEILNRVQEIHSQNSP